ncbi:PHD-type domain-containing protein [Pycnococcus provasolii]
MAYEPSTPTAHTPSASAPMMPLFDPRSMIPQLPGGSPTPAHAPPAGAGDAAAGDAAAGEDGVAEPHLGAAPGTRRA